MSFIRRSMPCFVRCLFVCAIPLGLVTTASAQNQTTSAGRAEAGDRLIDQHTAIDAHDVVNMIERAPDGLGLDLVADLLAESTGGSTRLKLSVRAGGSNSITVEPGASVRYRVVGELSDDANEGLALFGFDLLFDGGDLLHADIPQGWPTVSCENPMINFTIPWGINNPDEPCPPACGFGGTIIDGDLIQIGGGQNTINNTPDYAPYPIGPVLTGVAQPGGCGPAVLVTGTLTAPDVEGEYTLAITNPFANVIKQGETGDPFWAVQAADIAAVMPLSIIVSEDIEPPFAQCEEVQKLTASDAAPRDRFGHSVSVSGLTAVVGAPMDDCAVGVDSGSAYVFRFNGTNWVEQQKLTASDVAPAGVFGWSVSVSGDTALVGACGDECAAGYFCGSAYVFRFNGTMWVEQQKLTASDAAVRDWFGWSVTVSEDTAVVGARGDDCAAGPDCGSAYVYRFDGTSWLEERKLTAAAAADDLFGSSVSVSGDTAVVGSERMSAYVFRFDGTTWANQQELTACDAAAGDIFGSSVSVSGDTAVVGVQGDDCAWGLDCGSAYVFRFNGTNWVEERKLIVSGAASRNTFGDSVSISGDIAVVRAWGDGCAAGWLCGSAYVFRFNRTMWVEHQRLAASDAAAEDLFGRSVSVSGATILVGGRGADCAAGDDCGSAYVFSCAVAPAVVNLDIKPGGCPNPVNPKSKGVVPVAIVGSLDFDVSVVDVDSLVLARADGVGESVLPLWGRRGSGIAIEDVATPLNGEPGERCACHELGGDGIDDLSLKFSTSAMSQAFELNELPRGETIELVLRGSLLDGTTFEAADCIVIRGTPRDARGLRRTDRPK